MDQITIERISELAEKNNDCFIKHFQKLLSFFRGKIDKQAYTKVIRKWELIYKSLAKSTIVDYISYYFLMFRTEIEGRHVEDMLNFDYSKLINTKEINSKSQELMIIIITDIKNIYKDGNEEIRKDIEKHVTDLLSASVIAEELKKMTSN